MVKVKYDTNNSGGSWWLEDEDWYNLEKAGWKVIWYKDDKFHKEYTGTDGRSLGALAGEAEKKFKTIKEAIEEFEEITGQRASDEGCNCCGPPHSFSWKEKGEHEYCSGEGCLKYIFPEACIPKSLREAIEEMS